LKGSAIESVWEDRPSELGVNNAKPVTLSDNRAVKKILELSDFIVQQFHVATHTSTEWALHALSNDISNKTTERFNLYREFMGSMNGL